MIAAQEKADSSQGANGEVYWRYCNLAKGMYTLSHQHAHAKDQDKGTGLALRLWGRRCFHIMRDLAKNIAEGKKIVMRLHSSVQKQERLFMGKVLREWKRRVAVILHRQYLVSRSLRKLSMKNASRALQQWQGGVDSMSAVWTCRFLWVRAQMCA